MACHGDEALSLLKDASPEERAALSPFRYQKNVAVLHRDESVMPKRKRCWASWVYSSDGHTAEPGITVSYWMNRLQNIDPDCPLFVSLNPSRDIPEHLVFDRHEFDHPLFDSAAIAAQPRVQALQGVRNTWFCGRICAMASMKTACASAVAVARLLGSAIPWRSSRRHGTAAPCPATACRDLPVSAARRMIRAAGAA